MTAKFKPLITSLLTCMTVAALLATGGCTDERALQRQAVALQMQQVSDEANLARSEVNLHRQRLAELAGESQAILNQRLTLTERTKVYMLDHKMAVAALAAGAAGGMAVFSDDPELSNEAREIGAVVGLAALVWSAFNADEVSEVIARLDRATQQLRQLEQREQNIAQAADAERDALEVAQARLADTSTRAAQLRAAYEAA